MKCKEVGCDGEVEYEREPVAGGVFMKQDDTAQAELNTKKVVYLTCSKGHVHPYTIQGKAAG